MELKTPHIPLGISVQEGVNILRSASADIEMTESEKEDFYKVSTNDWECGFYSKNGLVHSSWYNDPLGRDAESGINAKVTLYLTRYGNIDGWQDGLNNGWIQFFSNENSKIDMAYGLHKDVLRFNKVG